MGWRAAGGGAAVWRQVPKSASGVTGGLVFPRVVLPLVPTPPTNRALRENVGSLRSPARILSQYPERKEAFAVSFRERPMVFRMQCRDCLLKLVHLDG